uniref:Uncharacterized protein n=1 Tax=Panagrolaimus sp. PS1159 TaxID=55785 RepID=A0AC35FLC5_9BILA
MDRTYYLNLNYQYHDARVASMKKLEEISKYRSLIEEYESIVKSKIKLPVSHDDVNDLLSIYLNDPTKKHVFIHGNNGKYISSENGETGMRCDRSIPLEWEKFTIEDVGDGYIALKSMGKYVSSEWGIDSMKCNRWKIGSWEKFEMIDHGNDICSFKGSGGYVSTKDGRKIYCNGKDDQDECAKFHLKYIQSLSDEIDIGWTLLNKHTIALCDEYDDAEVERAAIDPENYFYLKSIEVKHNGRENVYSTRHEERLFNQNDYKAAVKIADKKIVAAQEALDKHAKYINVLLNNENKKLQDITKMFNLCSPAVSQLQSILGQKEDDTAASKVNDENGFVY